MFEKKLEKINDDVRTMLIVPFALLCGIIVVFLVWFTFWLVSGFNNQNIDWWFMHWISIFVFTTFFPFAGSVMAVNSKRTWCRILAISQIICSALYLIYANIEDGSQEYSIHSVLVIIYSFIHFLYDASKQTPFDFNDY